jgi:hypothetical protein
VASKAGSAKLDPMKPSARVLVLLGSALTHVEEARSAKGHPYDWVAAENLLEDPELQEWKEAMRKLGLLPVKR